MGCMYEGVLQFPLFPPPNGTEMRELPVKRHCGLYTRAASVCVFDCGPAGVFIQCAHYSFYSSK